jgi:transcriptional regulator with XRE-family HTH domain
LNTETTIFHREDKGAAMNREEHRRQLQLDQEYLATEKELRPLLNLANNILRLRLDRGWSQADLARRTGTRQANISKIERGQGNPTYKFLRKLADAFGEELSITLGKRVDDSTPNVVTVEVPIYVDRQTKFPVYPEDVFSITSPSEERVYL